MCQRFLSLILPHLPSGSKALTASIQCPIAQISQSLITLITSCTGYIYEAFDGTLRMNVALKMEKKDKSKNILKFEY